MCVFSHLSLSISHFHFLEMGLSALLFHFLFSHFHFLVYIACFSGMAKGYEEILMGYGARSRVQSTERGSSVCRERNSGAEERREEERRKRRSQVRICHKMKIWCHMTRGSEEDSEGE